MKCYKNVNNGECCNIDNLKNFPLAFNEIKNHQSQDPEIVDIRVSINNSENNEKFYLSKGVVMYRAKNNSKGRVYLPYQLVDMIFAYYHNANGHFGIFKTTRKICEMFYRPNLANEIKDRVSKCELCIKAKPSRKYFGKLVSNVSEKPMDRLYIDYFGPLVRSKMQNNNILIIMDDHSKFVWLYAVRDAKGTSVIKILDNIVFKNFGYCKYIVSDNAKCFKSVELKNYLFNRGIVHQFITPYVPRSNKSERQLRTLKQMLKIYFSENQQKWDTELTSIQQAINYSVSEATKMSPHQLMFGFQPNNALSNQWSLNELVCENDVNEERFEVAIKNLKRSIKANKKRKLYSNENAEHPFAVNKEVFIETHEQSKKCDKFQSKLAMNYTGPYRLIHKLSEVTYLAQNMRNPKIIKKVHISQLKLKR
uniref:RNA-directed DNA polymerase n=1 Tax=Cuerna arida TaxID=1464854 RepID=A0A1B6GTA9_9HEMI